MSSVSRLSGVPMENERRLSVLEVMARRRTARGFDPARPLADDLLRQILQAATLAPSEGNLQPWRFLVVRRESNRQKLRGCAFQHPRVVEAPVVVVVLGYHHPHRSHLEAILERQLALGAITPTEQAEMRARTARTMERKDDLSHWSARAAMLAVATLLIAAESFGVGSALMEAFDAEKVREAFGIPEDHTVCGLVALGYAARDEPFPGRFELSEVCFEEHFGQPWTIGEP